MREAIRYIKAVDEKVCSSSTEPLLLTMTSKGCQFRVCSTLGFSFHLGLPITAAKCKKPGTDTSSTFDLGPETRAPRTCVRGEIGCGGWI